LTDDIANIEAARARLKALREQRLAERIEAGEIVSVKLTVVAGSATEARSKVEGAKADKLAELRATGDQREVVFDVTLVTTGVMRCGEGPVSEPWKPTAPPYLPRSSPMVTAPSDEKEAVRAEPEPVIESYVQVQVRQCCNDDDAGEISEGWYSIANGQLTLTDASGKFITSRAIAAGEDPKTLARMLLREKRTPSDFNRPLSYPSAGLA
jgi:hypothetical protein